jgi:hypothetical protein
MSRWFAALTLGFVFANAGLAQEKIIKIEVSAEKSGYHKMPICVPLSVPQEWSKHRLVDVEIVTGKESTKTHVQLTEPSIITESVKPATGLIRRDLHLMMPPLAKGEKCIINVPAKFIIAVTPALIWLNDSHELARIAYVPVPVQSTPIVRYVAPKYDTSSKEARDKSYKVFHHLFDPSGKRLVTNGGFTNDNITDPKKLLYPHHRGIMYGFNKCTYGPDLKKKADTWHCTGDTHVAHEKTLSSEGGGMVLTRHRVQLGWFGENNERFAEEERELTVYGVPGGTLVEFASRLTPTAGKIHVDGDPQHAGFQFRASNDVADKKIAAQTYFLRPDGKGKPGETRNWDPKTGKGPVDLPWDVMCFVLDGKRYSVCYLNHPSNPTPTRFSERDYGRFGGYFARDITKEEPLVVNYRLWLQEGEMTAAQAEALHTAFAAPPKVSVSK